MPGLIREAAESLPQRSTLPPPPGTDDIDGSSLAQAANGPVSNQNLDGETALRGIQIWMRPSH